MNTQNRHAFASLKSLLNILTMVVSLSIAGRLAAADPALESGVAKGTFAQTGQTAVKLTNVAAFVDVKDDDKPIILIISDKKLPTEKWTSEFDLMEAKAALKFSGVVFWIDKDGNAVRSDMYWQGKQSSVSGLFDLKLDSKPEDKEIKGTAKSSSGSGADDPKLDVSFHTTLK